MLKLRSYGIKISLRLLKRDSWFESTNSFERMAHADVHEPVQHRRRQPNMGFAEQRDIRRENADNCPNLAIDSDDRTYDGLLSRKIALPYAVAEDCDLRL